jgi:hypothetical protein
LLVHAPFHIQRMLCTGVRYGERIHGHI